MEIYLFAGINPRLAKGVTVMPLRKGKVKMRNVKKKQKFKINNLMLSFVSD